MGVDQPFAALYDELREVARRQRRRWRGDHTLDTTALLHEAYLKLAGHDRLPAADRGHFLALASRAMRQILCNYARDRRALKRGGDMAAVTLDEDLAPDAGVGAPDGPASALAELDEVLTRLEARSPRQSRVVECRFFGGLSVEETAEALGISPRTVKRDWAAAQQWLRTELGPLSASDGGPAGFLDEIGARAMPAALEALADDAAPEATVGGRYDIVRRIGSGGMGVVYEARDRELDRPVALKFLPRHLAAAAAARERLRREARAVSALDHPNVAVVYDIGTTGAAPDDCGGRLFIAMAYYPGETLRDVIARGPLPVADAAAYASQAADGLARAHRAGIVHRDIKPANLLVTDGGRIKIVDFGLALDAGGGRGDEATRAGTAPYMSPEQARGEAVDARADVWAVGVVLYEMLTGARPAGAAGSGAPPQPVEQLRPDVPAALARVVRRCLAADVSERYESAAELHAALGAGEARPSLLVLPFAVVSPDPDDAYLGTGLTEQLIADLSQIRALRVISRTSALGLRGRSAAGSTRAIASQAGVRYVLEGAVRKTGDALRVDARLMDGYAEEPVWTGEFGGTLADLFVVQEQVARAAVEALRVRLSPRETGMLARRPIADPRAYESYLRARYEAWRFSREGMERARRYIENALAIVGDNELLYSTLGHITAVHRDAGIDPDGRALERVEALAEQVFALDPDSARGHLLRAFVAFYRGDMRAAVGAGERTLALAPDDADAVILLSYVYAHVGRNAEARALAARALALDPLTPLAHAVHGFTAIVEGRFDDAVVIYRQVLDMDPESPFAAVCWGWALAYARRTDEAVPALHDAADRFPGTAFAAWGRSLAHALAGERAAAMAAVVPLMEAGRGSEMFARAAAQTCALAGETEAALEWVEREVELGMWNHAFLAEHDRLLDSIRGEPRFRAILARLAR